jgi:molybdenum cofactor biosynthesis protein A
MPEEGLNWLQREELMTYDEMLQICGLLVKMGIDKIRITGGEPFVRKDMMSFLSVLSKINGLNELTITTNGVFTAPLVPELKKLGIRSVNLSLDTLDANRFFMITHRDEFAKVMETLEQLLKHDIEVKINAVVMDGKNTQDIIPMVEMTKDMPVSVRFIEEMPFNGEGHIYNGLKWDYIRIMDEVKAQYPDIQRLSESPSSTSYNYHIPGYRGNVGVIAAYSRTFCGTCNRIRITPDGVLKTCLYDEGVMNIKNMVRSGLSDNDLQAKLLDAFGNRPKDGWAAEQNRNIDDPAHESMATIGG